MSAPADRARNRAEFPELARIVDEFRRVFGPGVRLVYGVEGGRVLGVPGAQEKAGPGGEPDPAPGALTGTAARE